MNVVVAGRSRGVVLLLWVLVLICVVGCSRGSDAEVSVLRGSEERFAEGECVELLEECRQHLRFLAESMSDEEDSTKSTDSLVVAELTVCRSRSMGCEELLAEVRVNETVCRTALTHSQEQIEGLQQREQERAREPKQLCEECPVRSDPTVEEVQQLQLLEQNLFTCQSDLTALRGEHQSLQITHSSTEIKLKLAKNELHVAKLNDEQEKLSLEAAQLEHESHVNRMQREIDRLNVLLLEARKSARSSKTDSCATEREGTTASVTARSTQRCTIMTALLEWMSNDSDSDSDSDIKNEDYNKPNVVQDSRARDEIRKLSDTPATVTDSAHSSGAIPFLSSSSPLNFSIDSLVTTVKPMAEKVWEGYLQTPLLETVRCITHGVAWEYSILFSALRVCLHQCIRIWIEIDTRCGFASHWQAFVLPYVQQLQSTLTNAYFEYLDEWYSTYLEDYVELVINKAHWLAYSVVIFVEDHSTIDGISDLCARTVQQLIDVLTAVLPVSLSIESQHVEAIAVIGLVANVFLLLFLLRNLLLSLLALVVLLSVAPAVGAGITLLKVLSTLTNLLTRKNRTHRR